jgi:hypothetical protein
MWSKMPANQLAKCAESACWRKAYPWDFSGLVLEDARQVIDGEYVEAQPIAPRRRAADVLDNPPTDAEPVVPLITPQQLKKLHAMFGEKALTNRDEALAWMSNVLERDITTSKEVTRDEASRLFAELEREPDSTPEAGTE